MELIDHTTTWAKGDIFQGRIMFAIGIAAVIAAIAILKSNHEFMRGMLIPLALLVVVCGGYGGFLAFGRPTHKPQ